MTFDPNQHRTECESYMGQALAGRVDLLQATQLPQSTRAAPWRLDVRLDGQERSYVLQIDPRSMEYEYRILKAVERIPVPTPHTYGLDLQGKALGIPCFFSDFIAGESLLEPVLKGEAWAEELYLDTICTLQSVTETDLGEIVSELDRETAEDVLDDAYTFLKTRSLPIADTAYAALKARKPDLPPIRFSNGDLWLDNFITKGGTLSGVIDFQNAAFSDPVFEFLLSFFVDPKLQGRGTEERFCRRIGVDPNILHWYHGLEYFDTLRWVLRSGKDFVQHSPASLEANLRQWLDEIKE